MNKYYYTLYLCAMYTSMETIIYFNSTNGYNLKYIDLNLLLLNTTKIGNVKLFTPVT